MVANLVILIVGLIVTATTVWAAFILSKADPGESPTRK